jgi:hypothetical protein
LAECAEGRNFACFPDQAVPKAERLQTPMVAAQLHWYFGLHQTNVLKKKKLLLVIPSRLF